MTRSNRRFSKAAFLYVTACLTAPVASAQTGYGPPLPTATGAVHFDLNPGTQVQVIPGLLADPAPVVGKGCFTFFVGFACDFTDAQADDAYWDWEIGITNTSSALFSTPVSFAWPTAGSPIAGNLQLAPNTTFTIDIAVPDQPETSNDWVFVANGSSLPTPTGIDSSVVEGSNTSTPGSCNYGFSSANTANLFTGSLCTQAAANAIVDSLGKTVFSSPVSSGETLSAGLEFTLSQQAPLIISETDSQGVTIADVVFPDPTRPDRYPIQILDSGSELVGEVKVVDNFPSDLIVNFVHTLLQPGPYEYSRTFTRNSYRNPAGPKVTAWHVIDGEFDLIGPNALGRLAVSAGVLNQSSTCKPTKKPSKPLGAEADACAHSDWVADANKFLDASEPVTVVDGPVWTRSVTYKIHYDDNAQAGSRLLFGDTGHNPWNGVPVPSPLLFFPLGIVIIRFLMPSARRRTTLRA